MKIIAFGHQKRVGKDQAGKFLVTALRLDSGKRALTIVKAGFADKIKQQCCELYGWAGLREKDYYEEHPHLKEVPLPLLAKSPRQIWIEFGTLVGREVFPNTWALYLLSSTKADLLVITDLRFPEEARAIQAHHGRVYKIERPSQPHTSDIADDPLLNWTGWDGVIINDGTLGEFHNKVITEVMPWLQK